MDRDDDMDFTVLGLLALERKGAAVSPRTIANTWSAHMPLGLTYTAGAYRNFPLASGRRTSAFRNPFREWIAPNTRRRLRLRRSETAAKGSRAGLSGRQHFSCKKWRLRRDVHRRDDRCGVRG